MHASQRLAPSGLNGGLTRSRCDGEREKLLGNGDRSYGSTVTNPAVTTARVEEAVRKGLIQRSSSRELGGCSFGSRAQMGDHGDRDSQGNDARYRRLTATTVYLPVDRRWYRRIFIPGITSRALPHSNVVHTTKYTVFNFIFKNLWEQFHRFANIYFLFIILLNFVPAVEAFGKEIAFIPLAFVLSVTAVKDIFEDYRRYRSDKEVNARVCRVYDW